MIPPVVGASVRGEFAECPVWLSRRRLLLLLAALPLVGTTACAEPADELQPPDIVWGEDPCAECGMILSEPRFAAASLVEDRGRVDPRLFDDIGDMLRYHRARSELTVRRWYVHDFETEVWLDAETAVFVHAPDLRTPMASHLAAFADLARAEAFAAGHDQAQILRFAELVAAQLPAPTPDA